VDLTNALVTDNSLKESVNELKIKLFLNQSEDLDRRKGV
jgi:hypothetical protein